MVAFQSVISVLVAAAVGWHTVAGCCAHHAHAATHTSPADTGKTCCDHAASSASGGREPQPVGHAEPNGEEHASAAAQAQPTAPGRCSPPTGPAGDHGCPAGSPTDCSEFRCAFAASSAASWQVLDVLADNAAESLVTESVAVASLTLTPTLRRQCRSGLGGIFSGNATRRHLALSILLL